MAHLRNYWTKPRKKSPDATRHYQGANATLRSRSGRPCLRVSPPEDHGACLDRYDSHRRRRTCDGQPHFSASDRLHRHPGGELLPLHQRHHAVAAVGHLSVAEGELRPRFLADRPFDLHLPGDGIAAAADDRHDHRQAADALFAALRHGLVADRPDRACLCRPLLAAADRRLADRHRLGHLPSGILAHRPLCLRRPLRSCAVAVPGRRQFRPGDGAAARRLHRRALRPDQHFLVRRRLADRHHRSVAGRRLVQPAARRARQPQGGKLRLALPAPQGDGSAGRADPAGADQERLHRLDLQLLHLLRHP